MAEPEAGFPPYAFVPGGPWPHPTRTPDGHSFLKKDDPKPQPIDPTSWQESRTYRRGIELFNAGYYWEAHEEWEGLWHSLGRKGPIADLIKALIKLGAAGVKIREGQSKGASTHAQRAAKLFESVQVDLGPRALGLDLPGLARLATDIAASPPKCNFSTEVTVGRVFAFELTPRSSGDDPE